MHNVSAQLQTFATALTEITETEIFELDDEQDEPIVNFVNALLQEAKAKNISDIHIESDKSMTRIRFRRDGLLYIAMQVSIAAGIRIVTRLKLMANLNIAERRLPQDGRLQLQQNLNLEIRINTCPMLFHEKVVLRLLSNQALTLDLQNLGLLDQQYELALKQLALPQGLILVTGPTGSGKTFTLYSALQHLNKIEKNIVSVEDPVEIVLSGINQTNINLPIGLTFAAILKSLLRQDPDIIMIGEIRDLETANIAIQAAQTGHLVLSTLHTNSAAETILRLQSMGVNTDHLMNAISLIIAQRLVRKLCQICRQDFTSSNNETIDCEFCHEGYQGRIGIFECIAFNQTIKKQAHLNIQTLDTYIQQEQFLQLWDAGLAHVAAGLTTLQELQRTLICSH